MKARGPVALSLTRQKLPFIDRSRYGAAEGAARGAYVLAPASGGSPDVVIIASGSEVSIALEARARLTESGARVSVVSMPSHEVFASQSQEYRDSVLPPGARRVAVEAAHPMSWYQWVGRDGRIIGLDRFGASAPYTRVYEELGITVSDVMSAVRDLLAR